MKIIQCLSDIEFLKAENKLPEPFIKEIEQYFLKFVKLKPRYLLNFHYS